MFDRDVVQRDRKSGLRPQARLWTVTDKTEDGCNLRLRWDVANPSVIDLIARGCQIKMLETPSKDVEVHCVGQERIEVHIRRHEKDHAENYRDVCMFGLALDYVSR